jgi:hypothetical protein
MFLTLSQDIDPRIVELLRGWDGVEFAQNAPRSVVVTEDDPIAVRVELAEAGDLEDRWLRAENGDDLFLIVNAVMDDATAARLEDVGIGYLDAGGRAWLPTWKRTRRVREPGAKGRRRLYAPSVRLAQLLADHPTESWTERGLAERGQTTQATAHRFLARLEGAGLIEREGRGPRTTRWVRDAQAMRRWLALEARPRRVASLPCYVRDPSALLQLPGRAFALTGAAAASEIGFPVLTREADPLVRVNVTAEELEDVPEALGGFRTETGANLILIADPDRLGFVDSYFVDRPRRIAPPSRIMLDLFLEARGEAAAEVFLDLWGGAELPR